MTTRPQNAARLTEGSLSAAAAWLSSQQGESAKPTLQASHDASLKALTDPAASRRILALEVVCRLSGEHAAKLLMGMLNDPDATVRCAAVHAAQRSGARRLASCLIVALDDSDPSVRAASRCALERMTGRLIAHADVHDRERRNRLVAELKTWWKRERLAELLAET
jgi:HEAT repeat protein